MSLQPNNMHPTDVASSDVDSAGNSTKEKIMTTTLTNPLEEDTLNQARAEAREILKNSEETTIELTVSGRESQQLGDALNQVRYICLLIFAFIWLSNSRYSPPNVSLKFRLISPPKLSSILRQPLFLCKSSIASRKF